MYNFPLSIPFYNSQGSNTKRTRTPVWFIPFICVLFKCRVRVYVQTLIGLYMLKTVLLLDGSEAMNCTADYLPSRLLALRPQLNRFVHAYLDTNPLASLGVVVMRDGVAYRLNALTTNAPEVIHTLEVKYFLFGGTGAMSLENGLRLALSELVDLKRIAKRARGSHSNGSAGDTAGGKEEVAMAPSRLRIILLSSSVTLIDPHDVFIVIKMVAQLHVHVDVISFCGAVHAFESLATATGGELYTPMNYDHLTDMLQRLALPRKGSVRRDDPLSSLLIPIGFPVHVEISEDSNEAGVHKQLYLACPQCALIQSSIPSTCPLCKLLLCSVPLIHTTFIAHSDFCPPTKKCDLGTGKTMEGNGVGILVTRCSLCQSKIGAGENGDEFWRCNFCQCERCGVCEDYVRDALGLCPTCIASGTPMGD